MTEQELRQMIDGLGIKLGRESNESIKSFFKKYSKGAGDIFCWALYKQDYSLAALLLDLTIKSPESSEKLPYTLLTKLSFGGQEQRELISEGAYTCSKEDFFNKLNKCLKNAKRTSQEEDFKKVLEDLLPYVYFAFMHELTNYVAETLAYIFEMIPESSINYLKEQMKNNQGCINFSNEWLAYAAEHPDQALYPFLDTMINKKEYSMLAYALLFDSTGDYDRMSAETFLWTGAGELAVFGLIPTLFAGAFAGAFPAAIIVGAIIVGMMIAASIIHKTRQKKLQKRQALVKSAFDHIEKRLNENGSQSEDWVSIIKELKKQEKQWTDGGRPLRLYKHLQRQFDRPKGNNF